MNFFRSPTFRRVLYVILALIAASRIYSRLHAEPLAEPVAPVAIEASASP